MIPEGWRKLEIGETILSDDKYLSSCGKWEIAPIFDVPVVSNGVIWIRRKA